MVIELGPKLGALFGILLLTLGASSLPALFGYCYGRDGARPRTWFYYLMLFSCALIATTGVNHVLPNAVDAFDDYRSGWGYPYPGVICTFAMVLAWSLDVVMDRRKQTVPVAYSTQLMDTDDDLPPADPYLFTGAIYLHSVLEGLVLGAAPIESKKTGYLYVIMAVLAIHKCFEGFSLAVLYEAYEYEKWSRILLLGFYSTLTPLGVAIGLVLAFTLSGVESLVAGICCAISAGVFIYAGISIMVSRVVPNYARTNWRFLFVAAGWAVSSAVSWFA
jgi:ZIP Zinc transporter